VSNGQVIDCYGTSALWHLLAVCLFLINVRGVSRGGWGSRPLYFGQGSWVRRGIVRSWTGREILLFLVMYRKYVRKWWLLKRNWIICPEIVVNSQFLHGKINVFVKLPEKIEIFRKFALKNRHFFTHDPPRFQTRLTPLINVTSPMAGVWPTITTMICHFRRRFT